MGTSNFHNEEASRIFAVECNDEYTYSDTVSNLKYEFESVAKEHKLNFSDDTDISIGSELRSFPARSIGYFYKNVSFLCLDIDVTFIPMARSGYYEGFNLDYEVRFELEGTEYESIECLVEVVEEYPEDYGLNAGLLAIHSASLTNNIEEAETTLRELTEQLFTDYSDPLVVVAQFSNDETIYEKAS